MIMSRSSSCGAKPLWTDAKGGILASVNRFGRGRVVLTALDYMVPRQGAQFPETTTKMPLVELLMRQIVSEALPVVVKGDIEYGMNKVSDGWWVYLMNNKGVTKYTSTPGGTGRSGNGQGDGCDAIVAVHQRAQVRARTKKFPGNKTRMPVRSRSDQGTSASSRLGPAMARDRGGSLFHKELA